MTKFELKAPLGSTMIPKQNMTEEELRNFFPQLVQDPSTHEIWKEKAQKDEIEDIVALLEQAGYQVKVK